MRRLAHRVCSMLCIAVLLVIAAGESYADDCGCYDGRDASCRTHGGQAAHDENRGVSTDAPSASCCQPEAPAPAKPDPADNGVSSVCPCCTDASPEAIAPPSAKVLVLRVADGLHCSSALTFAPSPCTPADVPLGLVSAASGPPVYLSNCTMLL